MQTKNKNANNNQWAGANTCLTGKTGVKEKDETNNQWTSTIKKSPDMYSTNCHSEKHENNKNIT